MTLHNVSDDSFETEVLKSEGFVLVDFWAEWCGPCKSMNPLMEELAKSSGDKIKIVKVNIDENPKTPQKFGIRGIPTFKVFKDGVDMDMKVGRMNKDQLKSWLGTYINFGE